MNEATLPPEALLRLFGEARAGRRYSEALRHLQQLPAEYRAQFQILAHEADLYRRLGDHEKEIAMYDRLTSEWPANASLWITKANALKTVGRTDEAVAASRKALEVQPTYGKAWWVLSELKTLRFSDEDIAAMESALGETSDRGDQFHLHFALGKAFEDRSEPAKSFEHYSKGNALRLASIPADRIQVTRRVDRTIELITAEVLEARGGQGLDSGAPIFIVGLPRSGSTLIEQILSSHPQVEGAGELPIIPDLQAELRQDDSIAGRGGIEKLAALEGAALTRLGEAYVDRARDFRSTERPRFIDKLPTNWLNVGFIRLILPNAKIIDARRQPMASGFSNFKQHYGAGAAFAYSLATIGRYYRDYLRLMTHFERVQPGTVHRVVNERLIDDFEGEVRRLLDYLGLPFDPACLDFHKTDRAVATPSAEQVRRPISREGVDQWRAYEPWLGELKSALGPALDGWDLPPGSYEDDGKEPG